MEHRRAGALQRRAELAVFDLVGLGHVEHVFARGDVDLPAAEIGAIDAVLDRGGDLTAIALDAGFASHSHFTTRFKGVFNYTPSAFRRLASTEHLAELRKIMQARRSRSAVD